METFLWRSDVTAQSPQSAACWPVLIQRIDDNAPDVGWIILTLWLDWSRVEPHMAGKTIQVEWIAEIVQMHITQVLTFIHWWCVFEEIWNWLHDISSVLATKRLIFSRNIQPSGGHFDMNISNHLQPTTRQARDPRPHSKDRSRPAESPKQLITNQTGDVNHKKGG